MTATERLRALLDERGVEHIDYECSATWWSNGNVECAYIQSMSDGFGQLGFMATPEQAIEATLGRGTCRMELPDLRGPAYTDVYVCSECGGEVMVGTVMGVSDVPKWCPWCGRKVEQ